jgi:hypothetical protein
MDLVELFRLTNSDWHTSKMKAGESQPFSRSRLPVAGHPRGVHHENNRLDGGEG